MKLLPKVNPKNTSSWKQLAKKAIELKQTHLRDLFRKDDHRFDTFHTKDMGILLDYSKNLIDKEVMDSLLNLAIESKLSDAIESFRNQEAINETEGRKVLHTSLRVFAKNAYTKEDKLAVELRGEIKELCDKIHSNEISNRFGEKFDTIINIGIGGSFLGPSFLYDALRLENRKMQLHFVSNIDPQDLQYVLSRVNLDTTLFLLVSKSFGTQETLVNGEALKRILEEKSWKEEEIAMHFFGVTSNFEKAISWGLKKENLLLTPNWVGGRFSVWGSVGFSVALAYGFHLFDEVLVGAAEMDEHFFNKSFDKNLPVLLALLGVWNVNFLDINNTIVVPYDSLLRKFPSYLQQMIMESNGKTIDRNGKKVEYSTSPIYWGEIGTDAQHSFFQLLHQGNISSSIDFLVAKKSKSQNIERHKKLQFNLLAQSAALAFGKEKKGAIAESELYKQFEGNTTSNLMLFDELNPKMIGKLMALYEHQTFVQGVLWNIFSFDQWGVELGKNIAKQLENNQLPYDFDSSTKGILEKIS